MSSIYLSIYLPIYLSTYETKLPLSTHLSICISSFLSLPTPSQAFSSAPRRAFTFPKMASFSYS